MYIINGNVHKRSVHHQRQHVRQSEVNGWEKGGDYNDFQAHYGRRFKGMSLMIIAVRNFVAERYSSPYVTFYE